MPGVVAAGGGLLANTHEYVWNGIHFAYTIALVGILFGYDTGVISGLQTMQKWFCTIFAPGKLISSTRLCGPIISSHQSLVGPSLFTGAFFGGLFAVLTDGSLSRRWLVVLGPIVFIIGVFMQTIATTLPLFLVGRILAGWGIGMWNFLLPPQLLQYGIYSMAIFDTCIYIPCKANTTIQK